MRNRLLSLTLTIAGIWGLAIGVRMMGGGTVAAEEWPLGQPTATPVPCFPVTSDGTPENGYAPGPSEGSREFCQIHPSSECFTATGLIRVTEVYAGLTRTGGPSSYPIDFIVREAPSGPAGPPGRVLQSQTVVVDDIPVFPNVTKGSVLMPTPVPANLPDTNYICARWVPPRSGPGPFIAVDESPGTPYIMGFTRANGTGPWEAKGAPSNPNHRALVLAGNGEEAGIFGSGFESGTTAGWIHR